MALSFGCKNVVRSLDSQKYIWAEALHVVIVLLSRFAIVKNKLFFWCLFSLLINAIGSFTLFGFYLFLASKLPITFINWVFPVHIQRNVNGTYSKRSQNGLQTYSPVWTESFRSVNTNRYVSITSVSLIKHRIAEVVVKVQWYKTFVLNRCEILKISSFYTGGDSDLLLSVIWFKYPWLVRLKLLMISPVSNLGTSKRKSDVESAVVVRGSNLASIRNMLKR